MTIDDLALARAIHVLAIVHWIGGVAAVTMIVLPRARALTNAQDAVAAFEAFETRFAPQARVSILLAGLSGLYMLIRLDAWSRFEYASFWWLDLMVAIWTIFAVMIYVLEPLFFHRRFHDLALQDKDRALGVATRLHVILLIASAIAIGAGVIGAHGGFP